MNEQVINELCQKFHTTVDNLIPIYSKYAMSKDIGSCIICIILIIISIVYLIYLKHYFKKEDIYDWLSSQFQEFNLHVIFMLSNNYYQSVACLNEMGGSLGIKAEI